MTPTTWAVRRLAHEGVTHASYVESKPRTLTACRVVLASPTDHGVGDACEVDCAPCRERLGLRAAACA